MFMELILPQKQTLFTISSSSLFLYILLISDFWGVSTPLTADNIPSLLQMKTVTIY